jgi:hypothetical protein
MLAQMALLLLCEMRHEIEVNMAANWLKVELKNGANDCINEPRNCDAGELRKAALSMAITRAY